MESVLKTCDRKSVYVRMVSNETLKAARLPPGRMPGTP